MCVFTFVLQRPTSSLIVVDCFAEDKCGSRSRLFTGGDAFLVIGLESIIRRLSPRQLVARTYNGGRKCLRREYGEENCASQSTRR